MLRLSTIALAFLCMMLRINAQPEIMLELFASGINQPTNIENMGDDRLFVTEQRGIIKIIQPSGEVNATAFLDIRSRVGSNANERGLLGLAFHPNYTENGYFYLNYTNTAGNTIISRFSVMEEDPDQANPDSEVVLLEIDQPYTNHNGGCIKFGPDEYLYIGMGDGGLFGDPAGAGQNGQVLLAKILRIDVDNGSPYGIPEGNPFIDDETVRDEIWALGVRNPWRFSFDRETGDMWIADVGQDLWEEVNFQLADSPGGENYGWNCYEGFEFYEPDACSGGPFTAPIHAYSHDFSEGGCSVTGGYVYRGTENPDLVGRYLYTDFCTGYIWSLMKDELGNWVNELLLEGAANDYSTFGENADGDLFLAGLISGKIYKIVKDCSSLTLGASILHHACEGEALGAINLILSGAAPFEIAWGGGQTGSSLTELTPGIYPVTVTDANNCQKTNWYTIRNDTPMAPEILFDEAIISVEDNFATYQWYLNGTEISGATNPTLQPIEDGDYMVEVTNETGCSVFSNTITITIESTTFPAGIEAIECYPNPADEHFNLFIKSQNSVAATIKILNANGRLYKSLDIEVNGSFNQEISLKGLSSGLYFVVLNTNKGSFLKKLIKQ